MCASRGRWRVSLFALLAFPQVSAQQKPDARALLASSRSAMSAYKSYELVQDVSIEMSGPVTNRLEIPVKMAVSNPGKLRIESNSKVGSMLIVSDGENTYMYVGPIKEYTKTAAASSPEALVKSAMPGMGDTLEQLQKKDLFTSASVVRQESVLVEGKSVACYVVEAHLDRIEIPDSMTISNGTQTFWIDKATKIAVKQNTVATLQGGPFPDAIRMTQWITVRSWKLNQTLPASTFVFTPPEGSKQVAEFVGPVRATPDLTGQLAPDFSLHAMNGKEYSLRDLRGKVVLLNFWATWCIPCRADEPMLEKLHQEFAGKGLVLLGVNVDDEKIVISKFLAGAKFSYPVLLSKGTEMTSLYSATAYPTLVLIDREGKIVFYHVGAGSEAALREKLAEVGLIASPPSNPEPK